MEAGWGAGCVPLLWWVGGEVTGVSVSSPSRVRVLVLSLKWPPSAREAPQGPGFQFPPFLSRGELVWDQKGNRILDKEAPPTLGRGTGFHYLSSVHLASIACLFITCTYQPVSCSVRTRVTKLRDLPDVVPPVLVVQVRRRPDGSFLTAQSHHAIAQTQPLSAGPKQKCGDRVWGEGGEKSLIALPGLGPEGCALP